MMDNLLLWLAEQADDRPGRELEISYGDEKLLGTVGAVEFTDVQWTTAFLKSQGFRRGCRYERLPY
jgi:hypothetical protein